MSVQSSLASSSMELPAHTHHNKRNFICKTILKQSNVIMFLHMNKNEHMNLSSGRESTHLVNSQQMIPCLVVN